MDPSLQDPSDPNYFPIGSILDVRGLVAELRDHLADHDGDEFSVEMVAEITRLIWPNFKSAPEPPQLDEHDLRAERIPAPGQAVHEGDRGVRLTHMPSGLVVESTAGRSYLQNMSAAVDSLRNMLAESAGVSGGTAQTHEHRTFAGEPWECDGSSDVCFGEDDAQTEGQ